MIKNHQSENYRQIKNRNKQKFARLFDRLKARGLNARPEEPDSQDTCADEIINARKTDKKRREADGDRQDREHHNLPRRDLSVFFERRQHLDSGFCVFLFIHRGNRQKMRKLPEKK